MIGAPAVKTLPGVMLLAVFMTTMPRLPAMAAEAEPWHAIEVEGEAVVRDRTGAETALVEGFRLARGDSVETRELGRVVLARGQSTLTMGPGGRMRLPDDGDNGIRTKIYQAVGSLLFRVEKQAKQHFEVETPYLAAVVKGTTFTVSADEEASAVHVIAGAVEVTALASGDVALLKPGLTAVVSPRRGQGLMIFGARQTEAEPGENLRERDDDSAPGEAEAAREDRRVGALFAADADTSGNAKQLQTMLGTTDIDVVEATNGFVKSATMAAGNSTRMQAATARLDARSGAGNLAGGNAFGHIGTDGNRSGGNAFGHIGTNGNRGGGNAFGHIKTNGNRGAGNAYGHDKNGKNDNKKDKKKEKDKKNKNKG